MLRNFLTAVLLRKLLVVALLLGVIGTGLDRVAVYLAQSAIERRAAADTGTDVQARVHGFPFLLQVAHRSLDDVTISGDRIQVGSSIGVRHVTARLRHIDVHDLNAPVAASMVLDGEVAFTDVVASLGLAPGALTAVGTTGVRLLEVVPVAGVVRRVTAIGTVRAQGSSIVLTATSVTVAGLRLPPALAALIRSGLVYSYPVPGLPPHATLQIRGVTPTGVLVRITAHDVSLA